MLNRANTPVSVALKFIRAQFTANAHFITLSYDFK